MSITLLVIKGNKAYDVSQLVQSIAWGGKKSAMARSIEVTMLDYDRDGQARPDIDVNEGHMCLFQWNGKELFRGIFVTTKQSSKRTASYKAYDLGMYLTKNMGTFTYKKKTATHIFKAICKQFEIPYDAVETGYSISKLTMSNTTAADAVYQALAKTYKANGKRFYVRADQGKLHLISRADNVVGLVLKEGSNAIEYSRERSTENTYTRVKLFSDANKKLASAEDTAIEAKLGIMQYSEQGDSKLGKAKLATKAKTLLKIKKRTEETLEIEAIGDPSVYSGVAVYLSMPYLGIKQVFYVDEDEHTFKGNMHTMRLKLNAVNDVEGIDDID